VPKDAYSELRKTYSELIGVSLRTAQRHEKSDDPRWLEFIGKTAAEGVARKQKDGVMAQVEATAMGDLSPFAPSSPPSFYDVPDEDLSPHQIKEKRAWIVHEQCFKAWQECLTDPSTRHHAILWVKDLPKLRDDHDRAQKERAEWEIKERLTFKASEIQEFVKHFIAPLGELLNNIEIELPSIANPDNQAFARSQIAEWKRKKLQPQIEEMLKGISDLQVA